MGDESKKDSFSICFTIFKKIIPNKLVLRSGGRDALIGGMRL